MRIVQSRRDEFSISSSAHTLLKTTLQTLYPEENELQNSLKLLEDKFKTLDPTTRRRCLELYIKDDDELDSEITKCLRLTPYIYIISNYPRSATGFFSFQNSALSLL